MPDLHETTPKLPDYESPPIAEVVCGVAFQSLTGMPVAQIGRLWEVYREQYPNCQEQPPVPPAGPRGPGEGTSGVIEVHDLHDLPLPRTWFITKEGNRLIQFQRDRFLHNWRKTANEDPYPRYSTLVAEFSDRYDAFRAFVSDNGLGEIRHVQYELTYVNHILEGALWSKPNQLGRVLPDFLWRDGANRFLQCPEAVNWVTIFALPSGAGRLSIVAKNGQVRETEKAVLLLELTVKGLGGYGEYEEMRGWFDVAHEWIVRGFADVTDSAIQTKTWGRVE